MDEPSGFSFSIVNSATSHYCLWSWCKCSSCMPFRAILRPPQSKMKVKPFEIVLADNYCFSIIPYMNQEATACFIPRHPEVRGVDRRVLCNTKLCSHPKLLIFMQQHFPCSFTNVVMLFPSYMQHSPISVQSHDQILTPSDTAHTNNPAGLWMGTHTYVYLVSCLWTELGIKSTVASVTPCWQILSTLVIWCTIFLRRFTLLFTPSQAYYTHTHTHTHHPLHQEQLLILLVLHQRLDLSQLNLAV